MRQFQKKIKETNKTEAVCRAGVSREPLKGTSRMPEDLEEAKHSQAKGTVLADIPLSQGTPCIEFTVLRMYTEASKQLTRAHTFLCLA